ncbi:transcription factor Spi-C [Sardina pilchardus]|uniref:transcription factor Spi-C n=1 Tax=Sardina pilchardus TaxID=27697 RepID=UPI002E155F97
MSSLDSDFQDAIDVIQKDANHLYHGPGIKYYDLECPPLLGRPGATCYPYTSLATSPVAADWGETSWPHTVPDLSEPPPVHPEPTQFYPVMQLSRSRKGRKKLRLFEYLHEALHDANMVDSIQWTDRGSGTFHFVSKNKEKLAECWGRRKGNRKTMTYQKMARALRNYSRTGEIVKVRRKLTYQFNPAILQRLGTGHLMPPAGHSVGHMSRETLGPHQHVVSPDGGYYAPSVSEWQVWYGQYPGAYPAEYDLATVLTSADGSKI